MDATGVPVAYLPLLQRGTNIKRARLSNHYSVSGEISWVKKKLKIRFKKKKLDEKNRVK